MVDALSKVIRCRQEILKVLKMYGCHIMTFDDGEVLVRKDKIHEAEIPESVALYK